MEHPATEHESWFAGKIRSVSKRFGNKAFVFTTFSAPKERYQQRGLAGPGKKAKQALSPERTVNSNACFQLPYRINTTVPFFSCRRLWLSTPAAIQTYTPAGSGWL